MSRLALILKRLIADARPGQCPTTTLPSGLRVSVRVLAGGGRQLSLTRTASVVPSRKEAEVCARDAGWMNAVITEGTTRSGLPCLLVSQTFTPTVDASLEVLSRVGARRPLGSADGDVVRALIAAGHLHVTPEFDRGDPCPYRLTDSGRQAVGRAQRTP